MLYLMRYGFVSDVHGNLEALNSVLQHLHTQRLDRMVFLGDAVGYGANPNEVCDLLRACVHVSVLGNHDAAVASRMDRSVYYDAARRAIVWCAERLSADNMAWLCALPYTVREGDIEFSHGAPVKPEEFNYLFGAEEVEELLPSIDSLAHVTFIGHSHLTVLFDIDVDNVEHPVRAQQSGPVTCQPHHKYIVTVGSVGQPRDHDPRACCGVYDTETQTFEHHRLAYDVQLTRKKILAAGLAPMFGDRLLAGV